MLLVIIFTFSFLTHSFTAIRWDNTLWDKDEFISVYGFPAYTIPILKKLSAQQKLYIFNEFHWGGYLNWQLPNDLIYLDGRGTVSWSLQPSTSMYENFRELRFEKNGLEKLEKMPTNIILIHKNFNGLPHPDFWNRFLFSPHDIQEMIATTPTELELSLTKSKNWQVIYQNTTTIMWKKIQS